MFKKNSLPMGMLTMVLIIGVALAGVGYALWSETLTISGTVQTGEVDVEFSVHEWEECVDVNGFGDCVLETDPDLVALYGDKSNAADCLVEFIEVPTDDPTDGGPNLLQVTITGMYPSWHCKVAFDVTSTGSVPVHVWRPVPTSDIPEWVATDFEECYEDGVQLHQDEELNSTGFCTMDIHFTNEQAEPEGSGEHTFGWTILATQWNEDPSSGPVVSGPVPFTWDLLDPYYKGFGDRYREFNPSAGEKENYLGVGNLGLDTPGDRVETDIAWGTTNAIEFSYDKDTDTLISNVDTGSNTYNLVYPNVTSELAALANGCTVDEVDVMLLQVSAGTASSAVQFNGVELNGTLLGDFVSPAGSNQLWTISSFDFSQSFTIMGTLEKPGPFTDSNEGSKLEMLVACLAP